MCQSKPLHDKLFLTELITIDPSNVRRIVTKRHNQNANKSLWRASLIKRFFVGCLKHFLLCGRCRSIVQELYTQWSALQSKGITYLN